MTKRFFHSRTKMRQLPKFLALTCFVFSMSLLLAACGGTPSRNESAAPDSSATAESPAESPADVPATSEATTNPTSALEVPAPDQASLEAAADLARREAEVAAREQRVVLERELAEKERRLAEKERQLAEANRQLAERAAESEPPAASPPTPETVRTEESLEGIDEPDDIARVEPVDVPRSTSNEAQTERRIVDRTLEAGTVLVVELEETVSSQDREVGELFRTRLVKDALTRDGEVAVPAGTIMVGRVTEARKLRKVGGQAVLGVDFRRLELADGSTIAIQGNWMSMGTNKKKDKFKILAGAAAGAILGQVLGGDSEATLTGAAAGAAAGTVAVVATAKGEDVVLEQGSQMEIQLEEVVTVRSEFVGLAPSS